MQARNVEVVTTIPQMPVHCAKEQIVVVPVRQCQEQVEVSRA